MLTLISILSFAALGVYYATLTALACFGLHRLLLLILYARSRRSAASRPMPDEPPIVTVQLPIYNELYVARRLIDAVCGLDYPRQRLEIQVLDDSTDETRAVVAETVAHYRDLGFDIHHLHRADRRGYKAGALAAGLSTANGELIAVFDADFVPRRDFLKRTVPHFAASDVGMVQARWDHLNRSYNLLTRIQAIFLDGHFAIEHAARAGSGRFFNFNGTAGVWRRDAIIDSGGWTADTLTEDLDLSYRAQLAGWRFTFLPEVAVPAELPVDIRGFKRQQYRWAKGSMQTARKLLAPVLSAPIGGKVKLEALIHLTNNGAYLLMITLSALVFPAIVVRQSHELHWLTWADLTLFAMATAPILAFYSVSQLAIRPRRADQVLHLVPLMALGIGLSVNNARAVISGLRSDGGEFERTPKYRIAGAGDSWHEKRYGAGRDESFLLEGLLAAYHGVGLYFALQLELWSSLPFLALFAGGFAYVFGLSAWQQSVRRRIGHEPGDTRPALPSPPLAEEPN